jgi:hypothetical protein
MSTTTNLQLIIQAKDEASKVLSRVSGQMNSFKDKVSGATKALGIATAAVSGLAVAMGTKAVRASIQYENALLGLATVARAFKVDQDKATQAALALAEDGLMTVSEAASGLKNLLASRFSLDESIKLMNALKDSAAFNRQGFLEFGQAVVGATEGIKNGNSILVDNAGITKNLSVILQEAGKSQQDLMKASTDASVRQALYNGILKEASIFQGDAGRAATTTSGSISKLNTSITNLFVAIGQQLNPYVIQATNYLNNMTQKVQANQQYFDAFGKFLSVTVKGIVAVIKGLEKVFESIFYVIFRGVYMAQNAWEGFKNIMKNVANGIIDFFKPALDFINKMIAGYNKLADKIGKKTIPEIRLGGRQFGGAVGAGQPFIVGEHRPEVFVPSQSGNIRQMDQVGGRNISVTFNNVNVRSDYDLDRIISAVKETLARDQKMARFGIRTI